MEHTSLLGWFRRSGMVAGLALIVLAAACAPPPGQGPQPAPALLMDAARTAGFYSFPWPNEIRKTPSGTIDVSGMPGVRTDLLAGDPLPPIPLLPQAVASAASAVSDFGTNSAVYFQSTVALDPTTLPSASESLDPTSTVQLIDLDRGERAPVQVVPRDTGDRFRPDHSLVILPYPGHPLRPATRYAAVVFDGVHARDGSPIPAAPLLTELDQPWSAATGVDARTWATLQRQRAEVRDATAAHTAWATDAILAFTVYTTQDVGREWRAVTGAVDRVASPALNVTGQTECELDRNAGNTPTALVTATVSLPRFQHGTFPYLTRGGGVVVGSDGTAVVARSRSVPVTMKVPCGTPPPNGWPIAAYIDGTGADGDISHHPPPFNSAGWVVAEIAPGMAGVTDPLLTLLGIPPADQPEILFYNYLNVVAGRGNQLQQAADHLGLLRALATLDMAGEPLESSTPVTTDAAVSLISGHSQGAQTLALVANADSTIQGVVSSAGGAGLYHTVAHSKSNRDLFGMLTGDPGPIDELNPLVQMLQTSIEAVDGSNYASSMSFLNVTGVADSCVPVESSRHLAGSIGLAMASTQAPSTIYGSPTLDPVPVRLPYRGDKGVTRAQIETSGGHFSIEGFGDEAVVTAVDSFVTSVAVGATPIIPNAGYSASFPYNGACGQRWDDPTDTYGLSPVPMPPVPPWMESQ